MTDYIEGLKWFLRIMGDRTEELWEAELKSYGRQNRDKSRAVPTYATLPPSEPFIPPCWVLMVLKFSETNSSIDSLQCPVQSSSLFAQ